MAPSNRQKAQDNYVRCKQLIKVRLAEGTLPFNSEGKVVRSEIYEALGVSRSVMNQNPRVRRFLEATERWARMTKLTLGMPLKESDEAWRASGASDKSTAQLQARNSFLEKKVAALTEEIHELRKAVKSAEWIDKFLDDPSGTQGGLPW